MKYVRALISIFLLICLDQYAKYMVVQKLAMYDYKPIIGDIFGLYYLENKGMAWGLFQNRQVVFLIFTIIILVAMGYLFVRLSKDNRFLPLRVCMVFLTSGAIGNMIDRVFHGDVLFQGSVVDFLYIKAIHFPVFNVADMYVTISVAVMLILLLFRYKEQDFHGVIPFLKAKEDREDISEVPDSVLTDSETVTSEKHVDFSSDEAPTSPVSTAKKPEQTNIDSLFSDEEEEDE